MGKVTTNKKLELVRAMRMQNHYNRQLFRSREGLLYDLPQGRGELYGLESYENPVNEEKERPITGSFRIRFVIAMVLLLFFVLCDVNGISYQGETTDTIFERIVESPDLSDPMSWLVRHDSI